MAATFSAPRPARAAEALTVLLPTSRSAPAFNLPDLAGQPHPLGRHADRTVLVHFFATWCEPCRAELASLNRIAADRDDIVVLAVDVAEPPSRLTKFLAANPVRFAVVLDADRAVTKAWGITTLPTSVLLGTGLQPRLIAEGEVDWMSRGIRAQLATINSAPRETTPP